MLSEVGLNRYEISNFATVVCMLHISVYYNNLEYLITLYRVVRVSIICHIGEDVIT